MYSEIASNKRKTVYIMSFFLILIAALAWLFSLRFHSLSVFYGILAGGIIYAGISYWAGTRWSLAVNNAKQITKSDNKRLWRIIENLSITDGLPMPKVYIMDDPAPNAFATGRDPNHASVCATSGLLDVMNDEELQGVFAHELGHVKNYDIRVSMLAFALAAVISLIADFILRLTIFGGDDRENNQVFFILGIVA